MMRFLLLLLLCSTHCSTQAFAKMQQVDSYEPLFEALQHLTEKSLVVFDVDDTLIAPKDLILRPENTIALKQFVWQHAGILEQARRDHLNSIIFLETKSMLIEPTAHQLFELLQKKNVRVIGLTATKIGGFGKLASIQDWRIEDLKSLGISFESSFQEHPFLILSQLNDDGPSPVFKGGILFSASYSKGAVLKAFLETVGYTPDQLIFVDDLAENVISVHTSMHELGIEKILSLQYKGAQKIPSLIHPEVAEKQIQHLLDHEEWLSEEHARTLLHNFDFAL